ncbi:hypothetical protein [Streptomyces hainanensis]|uniref:DUF4760 domain-containing protein n=1 Tax=Streptomyces hainanensis TaxID=402648 RepID=A0A4R4SR47_9ACTN|nr:hypothetical protein [Streptomyces hainanensis]TDC65526.1 hypothetical protein E1283_30580 [Streptomyces hainanensis]
MSFWAEIATQSLGALAGTLVGGAITVLVARWQTNRSITAQATLATAEHAASLRLDQVSQDRARSTDAARTLLERLADLYAWLPSLPDVSAETPYLSRHARDQCRHAMESLRRGMITDLYAISDHTARERYRELVRLAYDVGWREVGAGNRERQIRDAKHYLRYVQHSLEALIDGSPLPGHVEPPVLDRPEDEPWQPPVVPWYWGDPADGS